MTPTRRASVSATVAGLLLGTVVAFATPWPSDYIASPTATPYPHPTCVEVGREPVMPCYIPDRREPPAKTATAIYFATWTETMAPVLTRSAEYVATQEAQAIAGIVPTPCPVPPTPVAPWHGDALCWRPFEEATREARIASGESYEMRETNGPDGTPTVTFRGTVPPAAATWHATAQGLEIKRREP